MGKRIKGRKRHIAVDTLWMLLAVVVTGASVDDAKAALRVLEQLDGERCPRLQVVWADSKYHNHELNGIKDEQEELLWRIEVVRRPDGAKGFVLLPKRWVVERTSGWCGRSRRLSRDYELPTHSSECMFRIRALQVLINRLAPKKCKKRLTTTGVK